MFQVYSKVNQLYMSQYLYPLYFKKFFFHMQKNRVLSRVPDATQHVPVIYFIYSSVYTCQLQSPNLFLPSLSPANHKFVVHLWLYFSFVDKFIRTFFLIPQKKKIKFFKISHIMYLSVWLPSLSMTISRSIHVATNGMILFFFMAE